MSHHDKECICVSCAEGADAITRRIAENIARLGQAVITTGTHHRGHDLGMAYTVGLSTYQLPELLVFSLPPELAIPLLHDVAGKLKAGKLECNQVLTDIVNLPVMFLRVHPNVAQKYIFLANDHAGELQPAWQLVWSDQAGRFPWHPDFDAQLGPAQPILGVVPTLH